ncbi:MAG: hypothetical protein GY754_37405 [bacterium]|nr:hypothetical protein [bacterium]
MIRILLFQIICIVLLGSINLYPGNKQPKYSLNSWERRFDCGEYGKMYIRVKNRDTKTLTGYYTHEGGTIKGKVSGKDNDILTGRWHQTGNKRWGNFQFILKKWGFEGKWRYSYDRYWRKKDWNCRKF